MGFTSKTWWILTSAILLLALWRIGDVLRGRSGPEDLFLYVPVLIAWVIVAIAMARRRPQQTGAQVPPSLDPVAAAERRRRIGKMAMLAASLVIVLYTAAWVVRSGTVWMPVLVGGIALAVTWTIMLIVLRPKAES